MAVFQNFVVFDDIDSLEKYWWSILQDVPLLEFDVFLMINWGYGPGEEGHRGKVTFSSHIKCLY